MATVPVTDKFLEAVNTHVSDMERIDAYINARPVSSITTAELGNVNADLIHRLAWKEHIPLRDLMPKGWMIDTSRVRLNIKGIRELDGGGRVAFDTTVQIEGKFLMPPMFSTFSTYTVSVDELRVGQTVPQYQNEATGLLDAYARGIKYQECVAKWKLTREQVTAFFKAFKNVNTALKHTPSMCLYVPKDYLDRVNKVAAPRSRQAADTEIPEFDADALAAQAVTLKLQQSVGTAS